MFLIFLFGIYEIIFLKGGRALCFHFYSVETLRIPAAAPAACTELLGPALQSR